MNLDPALCLDPEEARKAAHLLDQVAIVLGALLSAREDLERAEEAYDLAFDDLSDSWDDMSSSLLRACGLPESPSIFDRAYTDCPREDKLCAWGDQLGDLSQDWMARAELLENPGG